METGYVNSHKGRIKGTDRDVLVPLQQNLSDKTKNGDVDLGGRRRREKEMSRGGKGEASEELWDYMTEGTLCGT